MLNSEVQIRKTGVAEYRYDFAPLTPQILRFARLPFDHALQTRSVSERRGQGSGRKSALGGTYPQSPPALGDLGG